MDRLVLKFLHLDTKGRFFNAVYFRPGLTCTLGLTNDSIDGGQPRAKPHLRRAKPNHILKTVFETIGPKFPGKFASFLRKVKPFSKNVAADVSYKKKDKKKGEMKMVK